MIKVCVIHKVSGGRTSHDRFYFRLTEYVVLPPVGATLMLGDEDRHFVVASHYFRTPKDLPSLVTEQDNRAFKCDLAELDAYCNNLDSEGWSYSGKKFRPIPTKV